VIDFTQEDNLAEYRAAAEKWAVGHLRPEWVEEEHRTGTHHNRVLHRLLADEGILGAGWPKEYGGSDVDPGYAQAVFDEIGRFGLRPDGWITTWMVGQTILKAGDEALKREVLPAALRGEVIIVLGYTEPSCGSDVAAAKTRAIRDGDQWIINGSKMFTSTAHEATHVFVLTRTNTEVPKHRGLTMFLVPLNAPGVEISPIYTLGGQRTNATYYGDVHVPDSARVGDLDGGWGVMRLALVVERSASVGRSGPTLAQRVAGYTRDHAGPGEPRLYDAPGTREVLARAAINDEVGKLLGLRNHWAADSGNMSGVEGAMAKMWSSEHAQWQHAAFMDLLGAEGVLNGSGPLEGLVEHEFRNSVVATIYGGSSEVMREIVAERRLKLPRSRPAS
jgi:alkylation response protein AidB-like acyl-CoA dehydrogenase